MKRFQYGRRLLAWLGAVLLLCPQVSALSARSAVVYDTVGEQFLYEKGADQQSLIASTTKIMTGLLVAEQCAPEQVVCIPAEACGIEGSSLYLEPGQRWTVRALLYGLMLHSGNDAAVALAMAASGSVEAFVQAMNHRAAELGLTQTHFANPHGLDQEANYSTARDLAKLAAAALENPWFAQVVSTREITVGDRTLVNHNKLLGSYEGADGVKTGYTQTAGRLLVSSATRQGRRMIVVTIDAPDDWNDHRQLLDQAFGSLESRQVLTADQPLAAIPLAGGGIGTLTAGETISVLLRPGEQLTLRYQIPRILLDPVGLGQKVGTVQVWVNGQILAQGDCLLE